MLDAYGYKATMEDTKQLDSLAREIFKEETGRENLDALIGHDQNGNLWIYASEEAKQYAESSRSATPPPPSPPPPPPPTPQQQQQQRPALPGIKALTQISSGEEDGMISRAESEPAIPTIN